jgi:hypothetical protein
MALLSLDSSCGTVGFPLLGCSHKFPRIFWKRRNPQETNLASFSPKASEMEVVLSAEVVTQFKAMLTNAIKLYEDKWQDDPKAQFFLTSDDFSKLTTIKSSIKDGRGIERRIHLDLLVQIVDEYERFLRGSESQDYVDESRVEEELGKIRDFREEI